MSKQILPFVFLVLYGASCLLVDIDSRFIVVSIALLIGFLLSLVYTTSDNAPGPVDMENLYDANQDE